MPQRTISTVWYTYRDEDGRTHTAARGETVDLTEKEAKRGDALGAFKGKEAEVATGAVIDDNARQGGVNTSAGAADSSGQTVPSELTDEEIDALSGSDLQNACEAAGIDTDSGGSLANGGLSADEKRDALRAFRDAS
jgi:hypothetical protein